MEFDYISNKETYVFVTFARAWLKVASLETTTFPKIDLNFVFAKSMLMEFDGFT